MSLHSTRFVSFLVLIVIVLPVSRAEAQTPRRTATEAYINPSTLLAQPVAGATDVLEQGAPLPEAIRPAGLSIGPQAPAEQKPPARAQGQAVVQQRQPARGQRPQNVQRGQAAREPSPAAAARIAASPQPAIRWSTAAGRAALGDRVHATGLPSTAPRAGENACVQPDIVKPDSNCCNYRYNEGGTDVWYRQPLTSFGSENAARQFAASVAASMPMFLPYRDPDVRLSHGWIYNGSDERFHGALDYSKKSDATGSGIDPAFRVRSVANGRVVAVFWDNWSGNIVIIEHTAPNGDRTRSAYKHLRNGFDNDLAMARGLTVKSDQRFDKDGNPTNRLKYQRFANLENPSTQHWGTNSQTIRVAVGDDVRAGQLIGWSGNTGPGGAGNGLNDDGTPKNANTANNHLHLMMAVPDPMNPGDWVQVDPYGVYNQRQESGCYDLLDTPAYVRLFAPFYPSFHNVPAEYVSFYWGYYTGMDMGLRTISLHRKGDNVLASGAFQRGLPKAWYMRMYMNGDQYQQWAETYYEQGFRPRDISVTNDANGQPRFTVIWKKLEGESFQAKHGLTDAQWASAWNQYVENGGMRVEERVAYRLGDGRRLAGVFVKQPPSGFYEFHYLTAQAYQDTVNALADRGWKLVKAEAEELPGGTRFGGIWHRKTSGDWAARHGLTPAEYQAEFEDLAGKGYRLVDVQGYRNSERFIAVWERD